MKIAAKSRNVVEVSIDGDQNTDQWFLLRADAHHDNAHADWDLEREHLEQAKERDALIIDAGDLFCAMQGKWDKRSDTSQCRPEHREGRYLDSLVETAADFYAPYADRFLVIGRGNHETSILKHHETDLTERLCERLRTMTGEQVLSGGYGGFVKVSMRMHTQRRSHIIRYFHGSGGGAPVTLGTIQHQRQCAEHWGVDTFLRGHVHNRVSDERMQVGLNKACNIEHRAVTSLTVPGYKDEYGDGFGGWHVERGAPAKPKGAAWLRLYWKRERGVSGDRRYQLASEWMWAA